LAIALAEAVRADFVDGAWWVDLAATFDPEHVAQTVVSSVLPGEPAGESPSAAIARRFADSSLLVLDNCEQVVDSCARLVTELLARAPSVRIITTSRQPLAVPGEQVWRVSGLPVGAGPAVLGQHDDAVELFLERVREVSTGFDPDAPGVRETVRRICAKLDGLPLALELAAARVPLLGVGQIAERLEQDSGFLRHGNRRAPERHRTLDQAVDWSHRLLTEPERGLFRRLASFRGTFSLTAAEAVCGGDPLRADVLDLLGGLVDQSLVHVIGDRAEPRYRLLETIRRYAADKLEESGEAPAVRGRHADFFLDLAVAEAEMDRAGVELIRGLERLELEHDNFRVAMAWLLEVAPEKATRLASGLWPFCYQRGYYREARAWFDAVLLAADEIAPPVRVQALLGAGEVAFLQCDYGLAVARLDQALALIDELGDERRRAIVLQRLGSIAREQAHYQQARDFHEQSLVIWERLGDRNGIAMAQNYLGFVAWLRGDSASASSLCGLALAEFRRTGRLQEAVGTLVNLGAAALYAGDVGHAREHLEEALTLSRRLGFQEGIAWSRHELAIVARLGRGSVADQAHMLRDALLVHDQLGDRWRLASVLEEVAGGLLSRRAPRTAAALFAFVGRLRGRLGAPVPPPEAPDRDAAVARVERKLGRAAFSIAWAEGEMWELEQAVETALSAIDELTGPAEAGAVRAAPILTARELAVLELVTHGDTNREIAAALYISPSTAGVHVSNILRKLGAKRRVDAAGLAHELGLLPVG
jgi:predicted ATPase/DNA-binding CsgD family transcriptional regulator